MLQRKENKGKGWGGRRANPTHGRMTNECHKGDAHKMKNLSFFRKDTILHVQTDFTRGRATCTTGWGNDIDVSYGDDAEWGSYSPLSDEEHAAMGYAKISKEQASNMIEGMLEFYYEEE